MALSVVVVVCMAVITLSPIEVNSQIPAACANSRECCPNLMNEASPNQCGSNEGRGTCVDISYSRNENDMNDVRSNWPYYFTRVCNCSENYWGYNCGRCKYGYYGDRCDRKQILPRKNILDFSPDEWRDYIETLQMARMHPSGYKVCVSEVNCNDNLIDINLYDLFIWVHHYAAKDNDNGNRMLRVDYAHEATGFPTWHRQFLLWAEWEIQYMLKDEDDPDYHTFRLSYWDWTNENRADIFAADKLGTYNPMTAEVGGVLFNNWGESVCWHSNRAIPEKQVCNPDVPTGIIRRCPMTDDNADPCRNSRNWPNESDITAALGLRIYDTDQYDFQAQRSFRNLLEGFEVIDRCEGFELCSSKENDDGDNKLVNRHLHNAVHLIIGLGSLIGTRNISGVMGDVAASPNDPVFFNHHTMIDCILEGWLRNENNPIYPSGSEIKKGHRGNDYTVPFFPLVRHRDVFKTADNFGYYCDIEFAPLATTAVPPGNRVPTRSSATVPLSHSTGPGLLLFAVLCVCFMMW